MRTRTLLRAYAYAGRTYCHWYSNARFDIERWCAKTGAGVQRMTHILAITSPRVSVAMNWRLASAYVLTGSTDGMMRKRADACALYDRTGFVSGPKVRAFARALSGDQDALVLDVWMARALDVEQSKMYHWRTWMLAQHRIADVAKGLGWSIAQTQAAIWAATVIRHGRKPGQYDTGV